MRSKNVAEKKTEQKDSDEKIATKTLTTIPENKGM
jgi:hypothetical protein